MMHPGMMVHPGVMVGGGGGGQLVQLPDGRLAILGGGGMSAACQHCDHCRGQGAACACTHGCSKPAGAQCRGTPAARPDSAAGARDGGTFAMYHGTSASAARSIEKSGFQQSSGGMLGRGVYCSRQPAKAKAYAKGSDGVVLELRVRVGKVAKIDRQGHPLGLTKFEYYEI